jgi:CheY-like chemotaxis protein
MEKKRVLLVDDEASFTRLMKLNLEANGPYEVEIENDSARVLDTAKSFKPDVIMLDVIMPDADGGQVAADLRSDPALRNTPIVFMTAVVSKDQVIEHRQMIGGQMFLAKPVAIADVMRAIEKALA